MKYGILGAGLGLLVLAGCGPQAPEQGPAPEAEVQTDPLASLPPPREGVATDRFARLALSCVHKEYPNKISQC